MPELRKDPILSRWVIISTERGNRPHAFQEEKEDLGDPKKCPFCPGNESTTPPEVYALRPNGGNWGEPGWTLRVVPNKFPVLRIEGDLGRKGVGMYDMMNGVGAHEVIIESEDHFRLLHQHSPDHLTAIFRSYRDRMVDLFRDQRMEFILLFKNQGSRAGASLPHPHSQLIALPIVPKRVMEELQGAAAHWQLKKRCIFCDIIDQERLTGDRIVYENDEFFVFCPFASLAPFETMLLPKRHDSAFHDASDAQLAKLAEAMRVLIAKYYRALGDGLNYNYILHTTPSDKWCEENLQHAHSAYHWHIELFPRLTKTAGFEWGTGFYINPTPPEDAAAFLRDIGVE
ncbi:MAG: galactose-1-phosphate uridylyltransferase [bacterium]|jgi:UDPglucose--hexose-1-phosphate uridylyltransferase